MITADNSKDILKQVQDKMAKTVEATHKEFQNLRTGRASIHLVEGIIVDYYGTPTPIKAIATVAVPDAKTILIQPWDATAVNEITKSIQASDLGLIPVNDGKSVRLQIPALTDERRIELKKLVKKAAEDGRVSVRSTRQEGNEAAKKLAKEKIVTEDDSTKLQKDIQKETDKHISEVDKLLEKKEIDITRI